MRVWCKLRTCALSLTCFLFGSDQTNTSHSSNTYILHMLKWLFGFSRCFLSGALLWHGLAGVTRKKVHFWIAFSYWESVMRTWCICHWEPCGVTTLHFFKLVGSTLESMILLLHIHVSVCCNWRVLKIKEWPRNLACKSFPISLLVSCLLSAVTSLIKTHY